MQISLKAPKNISAKVNLPASKSISNRALILEALSNDTGTLSNLAACDDTNVMVSALKSLENIIDIGAAGTSMRFLTAFFTLQDGARIITGSERMKKRPIGILVDALKKLGADIVYTEKDGFPPIKITGKKLEGGSIEIDGSISSQYLSALMMIGPIMKNGLEIHIKGDLISKPYAIMTLRMMEMFGVKAEWIGNTIRIPHGQYQKTIYKVEPDWSAASYWYEILSVCDNGEIVLEGLDLKSLQGDSMISEYFEHLGVRTEKVENGVRLTKTGHYTKKLILDLTEQPDMTQTLVLSCLLNDVPFEFSGLQSLKIKETDRINALITETAKLGFIIRESDGNKLIWNKEKCEARDNISIDTYDDHRMAMSFAPAAFRYTNLIINNPEVVSKSYPDFWKDLEKFGFKIENN